MSDVSDIFRWGYVFFAPVLFLGFTVLMFFEGDFWTAGMMLITGVLTLPNVHRFYKEVQMGQEIDDERFNRVIRKAGFTGFFATLITALIVGALTSPLVAEGDPGFLTVYGNLVTAFIGALTFSGAQVWYNRVGTQRNIKEVILGDRK